MADLQHILAYCDDLLDAGTFDDYCPNGVQVDAGVETIQRLVTGVTASQALVDKAVELEADLLLVHHGYFWRGESLPLVGMKGKRIRTLMQNGVSLMAYHLPLDAHPELGNNRQLAERLGFNGAKPVDSDNPLLWEVTLDSPVSIDELQTELSEKMGRTPLHLSGGKESVQKVGWCTGAAQGVIEQAAEAGMDLFISGEVSESTTHLAKELGIHYFAAGHHATERYGVQSLGEHLAERFSLEHHFIDLDNPV